MKTRQLSVLLTSIALLSLLFTSFAAAETNEGQTFTVTATTDVVDYLPGDGVCETAPGNGMCTLRAAIMEANALVGTDTIILPEADYDLTIPGAGEDESATGDLDITDELTILGAENTWSSIFATGLGDRVLDIIFSAGSVSVTWITLSGGEETYGGGIRSYAALELTHVNIYQNDAAYGGGIYSTQTLDLVEVGIQSNSASYNGGGIHNIGVLRAQDCHFAYNTAVQNGGGAYTKSPYYQEFENTVFTDNEADSGGGIYNETDLTLIGSVIRSNTASDGAGIYNVGEVTSEGLYIYKNTAATSGGGIYNEADLTITYSDIDENNASFGGGIFNLGVLVMEHSEVYKNIVSLSGGGLFNNSGEISLENVDFVENNSALVGGGIINIEGSIQGHDLLFDLNSAGDWAGAIENTTGGQVELRRATFSNNQALSNSGAINNSSEGYFTLIESTIIGNTSSAYGGGITNGASFELIRVTISGNQADNGGGIANSNGTLMNIENSTISGNSAELNGGGIYNAGTLYTWHSTITGNLASADLISPSGSGGGVYDTENAFFYFSDTILFGNHRRSVTMTDNDCYGTVTTMHYNLLGTLDDCTLEGSQGHDLIGADPLLEALADNGGLTETRALLPGSPAIDAADPAGCFGIGSLLLSIDQRGHPLPWDGDADGTAACDIGAYEAPLALLYLPMTVK